jgi:hypothetical protein
MRREREKKLWLSYCNYCRLKFTSCKWTSKFSYFINNITVSIEYQLNTGLYQITNIIYLKKEDNILLKNYKFSK